MQYVLGVSAAVTEAGTTEGGVPPNLRHDVTVRMRSRGVWCDCIRCREVGLAAATPGGSKPSLGSDERTTRHAAPTLLERWYEASGGREVFLSYEILPVGNGDDVRSHQRGALLCGFLRLRLPRCGEPETQDQVVCFPELVGAALVRELHVYGQLQPTAEAMAADTDGAKKASMANKTQHSGIGRKLLERAETIATSQGWSNIAVISGVGARNYYRKFGYRLQDGDAQDAGGYMIKFLHSTTPAAPKVRTACCSSTQLAWAVAMAMTLVIVIRSAKVRML
jgi:histone acetyltransferase (RNA polymerase elongator complex component)